MTLEPRSQTRKTGMVQSTFDAKVDYVLELIETMVASEGGTINAP
jgi:hypothetical protein